MNINYKMISLILHAGNEVQVAIIAKKKKHSAKKLRIPDQSQKKAFYSLEKTVGFLEKQWIYY